MNHVYTLTLTQQYCTKQNLNEVVVEIYFNYFFLFFFLFFYKVVEKLIPKNTTNKNNNKILSFDFHNFLLLKKKICKYFFFIFYSF